MPIFLPLTEIHPDYFKIPAADQASLKKLSAIIQSDKDVDEITDTIWEEFYENSTNSFLYNRFETISKLVITHVLTKLSPHSEHSNCLVLFQYTTFLRVILYLGRMYPTIKICKCV